MGDWPPPMRPIPSSAPPPASAAWSAAQALLLLAGAGILAALLLRPALGLDLLWNVLIPVAPALLLLAPGLWRNLCPLATVALLPNKLRRSRGLRIPKRVQAKVALAGVLLLFLLIPLRRIVLDQDAFASALLLIGAALLALGCGLLFESKAGWCAGLCPVRPVETLYGERPIATFANAHCRSCEFCAAPCPDSAPAPQPGHGVESWPARAVNGLMIGAFPGLIWGWFHAPDWTGGAGWRNLASTYGLCLGMAAASLLLYLGIRAGLAPARHRSLARVFGLSSIAAYYWYRLPALIGFGLFPGDGTLVDLSGSLPVWTPRLLQVLTIALALLWLAARGEERRSWLRRPAPAWKARMKV